MTKYITIPGPWVTSVGLSNSKTLTTGIDTPAGFKLVGASLQLEITRTDGAADAAQRLHDFVRTLRIEGSGSAVLDIKQKDALPMCSINSHILNAHRVPYRSINEDIVRNPALGVAAVKQYANYDFNVAFPGEDFNAFVELEAPKSIQAAITAIETRVGFNWHFAPEGDVPLEEVLYGNIQDSLNHAYHNFSDGVIFAASEIQNIANSVHFGDRLDEDTILTMQDIYNEKARGLAAAGTTELNTASVQDPATGANTYGLAYGRSVAGSIAMAMKVSTKVGVTLLSTEGTPSNIDPRSE